MIDDETIRKLRELKLPEMVDILQRQKNEVTYTNMPFDERIQYVTDYIYQIKQDGKIKRLVKGARFRFPDAEISSVHYEKRGLDKRLLIELGTCVFIRATTMLSAQGSQGQVNHTCLVLLGSKPARMATGLGTEDYQIYLKISACKM